MTQLNNFVSTHLGVVGLAIFVGCVVLLLIIGMLFIQSRRIALISARLDALTQGVDGASLEGVLDAHLETVVRVARDLDEVQVRTAILESGARLHFARLGLVRFNPFDDTGGNQSFALAMLDANNDGSVITSLHSRTGTRLYAKAVFGGEAESTVSSEEARAVEIAVSQGAGGTAAPTAERRVGTRASGRTKNVPARAASEVAEAAPEVLMPKEAVLPREASVQKVVAAPNPPVAPKPPTGPKPAAAPKAARPSRTQSVEQDADASPAGAVDASPAGAIDAATSTKS